ncbi:MAG: transcriptional repressor [Chloroflexota bacterium]|nr:transcriptional repressor [Chloroflexota bacterium]
MKKNIKNIKAKGRQILVDNNIPITQPRLLLLEILLKSDGPLKIQEVIKLSKGKLAISSLYRIINDLKNFKLINEFQTLENTKVIELADVKDEHHHHIFCESCGAVYDFEVDSHIEKELEKEIIKIKSKYDIIVKSHSLELLGLCKTCRDK